MVEPLGVIEMVLPVDVNETLGARPLSVKLLQVVPTLDKKPEPFAYTHPDVTPASCVVPVTVKLPVAVTPPVIEPMVAVFPTTD